MRTDVVLKLIDELRRSGYEGYTQDVNSPGHVEARMKELCTNKCRKGTSCSKE